MPRPHLVAALEAVARFLFMLSASSLISVRSRCISLQPYQSA